MRLHTITHTNPHSSHFGIISFRHFRQIFMPTKSQIQLIQLSSLGSARHSSASAIRRKRSKNSSFHGAVASYLSLIDSHLPFFELRRPGEFVDGRSPPPVLVPGLTLVLERRVRHVAGPLLNFHRSGPSAPPWCSIYRRSHSLVTSEAFAVQARRMGLNLVDPPLSAPAALPESLLHDRP